MMLILGLGYLVMALYAILILILIFGGIIGICCYREQMRECIEVLSDNPLGDRIPYLDVIQGGLLKKKKFGKVKKEHRTMEACAICLGEYTEADEVAELGCDERHYFHATCLEDWIKRKPECPLCKKPL